MAASFGPGLRGGCACTNQKKHDYGDDVFH
jgi:hypothetical protein